MHYSSRKVSSIAHRSFITSSDKLVVSSAALVSADVAALGNLLHNTTYKSAYVPSNQFGPGGLSAIGSVSTADDANDTHMVDLTIPQVVGASMYDVFFSTDVAPLWVARITEAQRAAGAKIIAVGTVVSPSVGVAAGKVRVDVVGTGLATSHAIFAINTAYVLSGITPIDVSSFTEFVAHVYMYVSDLRSAPSLTLVYILEDDIGNHYVSDVEVVTLLSAAGKSMYQDLIGDCPGARKLYVLVDSISGQGAQVSVSIGKFM